MPLSRAAGVPDATDSVVEYTYNPDGIRTESYSYDITNGTTIADEQTTLYLIDPANHTGYAQVLSETVYDKADPDPATDSPSSRITYCIGDDIISQTKEADVSSTWTVYDTEYLLYDGHGSTRQLADDAGAIVTDQNFSYDAYGVMLGSAANPESGAGTNLLYAGEQYDSAASMYYNRARYYNPSNGRFNRTDPYAGSPQDPQSLHKYLYCHANPVNGIDPSGMFSIVRVCVTVAVIGLVASLIFFPNTWGRAGSYGINDATTPMNIAVVDGKLGGLHEYTYSWSGFKIREYTRELTASGHNVTYSVLPDEQEFINILNSRL